MRPGLPPTGKLIQSSQTYTAIVFRQTLRGRGGEEGKEENGRGSACPLLFTCAYFISAVIATATWLGGWLGGWVAGCLSQPVLYQND